MLIKGVILMLDVTEARHVLQKDAMRIRQIIDRQNLSRCPLECKAFEEVIDTQMYGFSCKIDFAIRTGILTEKEGHAWLSDLERELTMLYEDVPQKIEGDQ